MKIWRSRTHLYALGLLLCYSSASAILAAPVVGRHAVQTEQKAEFAVDPYTAVFPSPQTTRYSGRKVSLPRRISIASAAISREEQHAVTLAAGLLERSGLRHSRARSGQRSFLRFRKINGMPPEGYRLTISSEGVLVEASDQSGLFYGGVSFWQLATSGGGFIPVGLIEDSPRYRWRGLMLDSARHFQSPEFVRKLIDWMAAHKLNRLHWHLVDDQGWRIEIKKYPRLVETGAQRPPAVASGAPALPPIGGYYTQDQIRDIVAYASARGIEIVPEIEMPGHALSGVRAYPEHGLGIAIPPGVESHWGVFPWLYNTDDATFTFLTDILDEVTELFPSKYIHVGGDEAVKDQWKASPVAQANIRKLGITDENALQSWLMSRIGAHLQKRGRTMVGWDEILEGGIPPNATIMSWRGREGALKAAQAGHDAILSPAPALYFDHIQSVSSAEPPGRGGVISLSSVLAFDPNAGLSTEQERSHILGLQANLWTEHVRTEARAAWMAFPRASAVAQVGWSGPYRAPVITFVPRLMLQLERLQPFGLRAADSAFRPEITLESGLGGLQVAMRNEVGASIYYTLDGSEPTTASLEYKAPFAASAGTTIRARSFQGGQALPGVSRLEAGSDTAAFRDSRQLRTCSGKVDLVLEDDFPAYGERAAFQIDILHPCWIYEKAQLRSGQVIMLEVGQLPFNFQVGTDRDRIPFRARRGRFGEFEVRARDCDGPLLAELPLEAAADNPGVTRLSAALRLPSGFIGSSENICISYTASGPDPLWAVKSVNLVSAP